MSKNNLKNKLLFMLRKSYLLVVCQGKTNFKIREKRGKRKLWEECSCYSLHTRLINPLSHCICSCEEKSIMSVSSCLKIDIFNTVSFC